MSHFIFAKSFSNGNSHWQVDESESQTKLAIDDEHLSKLFESKLHSESMRPTWILNEMKKYYDYL